ncbi:MAG TPA: BON domain-containing protein [Polyangiaceae bacterium]
MVKDQVQPGSPGAAPASERWMHGAADDTGHRGKAPKNYVRSDERVFEDVCESLAQQDAIDASDMTVHVDAGVVTLAGSVATAHMKELAEEVIIDLPGVKAVRNTLRAMNKET